MAVTNPVNCRPKRNHDQHSMGSGPKKNHVHQHSSQHRFCRMLPLHTYSLPAFERSRGWHSAYGADRPLSQCLCAQKAAEMHILEQNGCMGLRHIIHRHTAGLFVPDGRTYLFPRYSLGSNSNGVVWCLPPRLLQMVKPLG